MGAKDKGSLKPDYLLLYMSYRLKDLAALLPGLVAAFGNQKGMSTMQVSSVSAKKKVVNECLSDQTMGE